MKRRFEYLKMATILGSFALLALQAVLIARGWDYYQYDFRAYYIGASLFVERQDPYSFEALRSYRENLGLRPNDHRFLYAPYMLWVFTPLAALSFQTAFFLWLSLQILAITAIWFLTLKYLRPDPTLFAVLLAVGLNGSVAAVLRTGQLTLIMLALIMFGLTLLASRRVIGAAFFLTLAAIPKLWLSPMLALLVSRSDRKRIVLVVAGLAIIAGLLVLGAVLYPEFHRSFVGTAGTFASREVSVGPQNGSLQNLLNSALLSSGMSVETVRLCWIVLVLSVGAVAAFRYVQTVTGKYINLAYLFGLIVLSLCLISPRIMIYQWSIALPTLAYVISHMRNKPLAYIILALALVPTIYINRYLFGMDIYERIENVLVLPWAFSNLLVISIAWLVLVVTGPEKFPRNHDD